jgi:phenylpropionate dioxygenase-like ring-hydroxylating dioxygenase large terminal subunit
MDTAVTAGIWQRGDYSRVPYRLYHDQALFEQEQEKIFRGPVWSVLGFEAEVKNAGDYRLTYVGDTPVVYCRNDDGTIRAFVNRCAHRGAEVVRYPSGNQKDFTCIYHAWCYSQAGDLVGVPFERGAKGKGGMPKTFMKSEHGLAKVRVQVWNGLVFGTFSDATEPLEDYLGPLMSDHVGELLSRPIKILGYHRQRVSANWKLYHENIRDAYHGSLLHEFNRTFGMSRLTQVAGGYMDKHHRHSILFQYAGSDSDEEARKAYAENGVQRGEYMTLNDYGIAKHVRENPRGISTRIISVFPNVFFHQIYNSLAMRQLRPLGNGEFELLWTLFGYEDDTEEMTKHRLNQANMVGPAGLISMEDGEALEMVQRTTATAKDVSGVVEMGGVGPIGNVDTRAQEVTIRGFWAYYSQLMGLEPDGAER